jgi:serine/threonine protein kinase
MTHGIIHRDIKPENIMLDTNSVIKILDFGLGKFVSEFFEQQERNLMQTEVSTTMGSVDFTAPEQWKDASTVSIQADIYSLGCVCYFLLAGYAPFDRLGWNKEQRMIAHLQEPVPLLPLEIQKIPPEVEACLQKMLAKKPEERFAQPSEIIAVLHPFADDEHLGSLIRSGLLIDSGINSGSRYSPILLTAKANPLWRKYLPHSVLALIAGAALIHGQWKGVDTAFPEKVRILIKQCKDIDGTKYWLDTQLLIINPAERYAAGDPLELQLLAISILIDKKQEYGDSLNVDESEKYIVPLLNTVGTQPKLLPYYDAVIQCYDSDIRQQAIWILKSRNKMLPASKSCLLFYFPPKDVDGFAVFISKDRQTIERFALPFNRQQVIESAAGGTTLAPPGQLVELVTKSWQVKELVLSWDDSMCWSSEEQQNALTPSQWNFAQLPTELFWGTVK